jgi:hypothetical protein
MYFLVAFQQVKTMVRYYRDCFFQVDVQFKKRNEILVSLLERTFEHEAELKKSILNTIKQISKVEKKLLKRPEKMALNYKLNSLEKDLELKLKTLYKELDTNEDIQTKRALKSLKKFQHKLIGAQNNFNEAVSYYNKHVGRFPSNIIAKLFYASNVAKLRTH